MATKPNLVRVSIFVTRKESVTETQFHEYWTRGHSKVVSEWLQKHGVVRYAQVSDHLELAFPRRSSSNLTIAVPHTLMV